jgi:murein L,D-transpeptidase YcbB/YkuD
VKAVEEHARDLLPILAQVAEQLFPDIDDRFAPGAAATAMFDPVRVKWLQTALNVIGTDPLDVDGEYGPLTNAAVKRFQETHGLVADGWAGDVTHAAFQAEVAGMR